MQNKNPKSLFGVDLNQFSRNADFATLARNVEFMYLRSSGSGSGRFKVDTKFIEYAKGCRDYGIPVGAYHYAVPSYDLETANQQCDDFIKILQEAFGEGNYGDIFPVIDIETPVDKSISTDALLDWVARFRDRFEYKTRRKIMIYTGAFFIDLYNNFKHSKKGYILSGSPLWIAMYTSIPGNPPYPKDQGGWKKWTVWQYSDDGSVKGVTPPTDLNWGPDSIDYLRPPRKVAGFKGGRDGNSLYLSWDKNPDLDLAGYNIFLNKEYIKTLGKDATQYTINLANTKVKKGDPLEVGIEAFDQVGDYSKRNEIYLGERASTQEYHICYPDEWFK